MIEVKQGIFWNPEATTQSEEAMQWLMEEVKPNLGQPVIDGFGRPDTRTFENDAVVVVEKQLYINENTDWARKGVQYIVTSKIVQP